MTRLIDADNVLKALNVFRDRENGNSEFLKGISSAKEIVENEPTVPSFGQWISVKDRLPKPHRGEYLVCDELGIIDLVIWNGEKWVEIPADVKYPEIKYWMPLPEPQEDDSDE